MGITERTIRISRGHNTTLLQPKKAIPTAIKTLGDYLLVKRYEKGLKQSYIAQIAGVTVSTVRQWEIDVQKPTHEQQKLLEKALGLHFFNGLIIPTQEWMLGICMAPIL